MAKSVYAGVRLEGFKTFARELKAASDEFPKAMKKVNEKVADFVADEAKGKARSLGGVQSKSADALRATKTAGYAAVRIGGSRYPYALGAEFGSKRYGQFPEWRGGMGNLFTGSWGYFLGPSIKDNEQEIETLWFKEVDHILDDPFDG